MRCAVVTALCLACATPAHAGPALCARAEAAVASVLRGPLDPEARLDLAPFAPASALDDLLRAAKGAEGLAAVDAYMAIGLSRHAAALEALRALPPPPSAEARVAAALALLALGDGAGTGTVAAALSEGPAPLRRRTAEALARMRQTRPRHMLYDAMRDEDPMVRLVSAEVQVRYRSRRARRVLRELLEAGPEPARARAAAALFEVRARFADAEIARLPEALRGPALVRSYVSLRKNPRKMRSLLPSRDAARRAGAFAALVAAGGVSPGLLKRYAKVAVAARGPEAEAQLTMALALLGEEDALEALAGLDAPAAKAAADVLWAFSAAPTPYHQLDPDHAARLGRAVQGWWRAGHLDPEREAQTLEALARADRDLGSTLARARADGGPGPAFDVALSVLRAEGRAADAERLLGRLGTLPPSAAAAAVLTATAVCAR